MQFLNDVQLPAAKGLFVADWIGVDCRSNQLLHERFFLFTVICSNAVPSSSAICSKNHHHVVYVNNAEKTIVNSFGIHDRSVQDIIYFR